MSLKSVTVVPFDRHHSESFLIAGPFWISATPHQSGGFVGTDSQWAAQSVRNLLVRCLENLSRTFALLAAQESVKR